MGNTSFGDKMKKILMLVITFFYLLFLWGCSSSDELRLRILANSDDAKDQMVKQEVKNYLKSTLINELINLDVSKIEQELSIAFPQEHIQVEITYVRYEAKSYHSKIVPSGNYKTLLVKIGKGEGKNFWTLLYPEFFNISFEDDHEIEYRSFFYDRLKQE